MESKFQTSFIPKRPITSNEKTYVKKKGNAFMFIAMLIFIASIAGAVFSVLWHAVLTSRQESYKAELANIEDRINIDLIEKIKKADTKMILAKKLLDNHLASSEVFEALRRLTIEGVSFTEFDFSMPSSEPGLGLNQGNDIEISMTGVSRNFSSLAFQAKVFGESESYGLSRIIRNPIISDLGLDEKGNVTFSFAGKINQDDLLYSGILNNY